MKFSKCLFYINSVKEIYINAYSNGNRHVIKTERNAFSLASENSCFFNLDLMQLAIL